MNLYQALREAFPDDVNATAVTVTDGPGAGLCYSWADLDRASAMMRSTAACAS